jgi:transposase
MIRKDLQNHVRSIFAEIGVCFPRAIGRAFVTRIRDFAADHPSLRNTVDHLLAAYESVFAEQVKLDKKVRDLARDDSTIQRFMTVPVSAP